MPVLEFIKFTCKKIHFKVKVFETLLGTLNWNGIGIQERNYLKKKKLLSSFGDTKPEGKLLFPGILQENAFKSNKNG